MHIYYNIYGITDGGAAAMRKNRRITHIYMAQTVIDIDINKYTHFDRFMNGIEFE